MNCRQVFDLIDLVFVVCDVARSLLGREQVSEPGGRGWTEGTRKTWDEQHDGTVCEGERGIGRVVVVGGVVVLSERRGERGVFIL